MNAAIRARRSANLKARWADPAGREKLIKGIKACRTEPAMRERQSAIMLDRWADPEVRAKLVASMRGAKSRRRATRGV